jgi:aldose 1-epimerase
MKNSSITAQKFGSYQSYILKFKESQLQVVSGFGCNPIRLILDGQQVLDGNDEIKKLEADFLCKGDFLAPFPNRISGGTYVFKDVEHQLIKNEVARGHALHGFVMKKSFEIVAQKESEEFTTATFKATIHEDEFQGYPFEIDINITFTLKANSLEIQMGGKNLGKSEAPFGIGWHPYFTVRKKIDECKLRIPALSIMETDPAKELIPTGKHLPNTFGTNFKNIGTETFDTCFVDLVDQSVRFENIEMYMDNSMKYLQIYTPEDRNSIAIEPMTCAPDAFNNGLGLITLSSNEEVIRRFGIRIVQ